MSESEKQVNFESIHSIKNVAPLMWNLTIKLLVYAKDGDEISLVYFFVRVKTPISFSARFVMYYKSP